MAGKDTKLGQRSRCSLNCKYAIFRTVGPGRVEVTTTSQGVRPSGKVAGALQDARSRAEQSGTVGRARAARKKGDYALSRIVSASLRPAISCSRFALRSAYLQQSLGSRTVSGNSARQQ